MFCPKCHDEYRPGFTRCATCRVDLVEQLSSDGAASGASTPVAPPPVALGPVPMAEYCGFLSLEDARSAREVLRVDQIRSDIVIRDGQGGDFGEEYWLRIESSRYKEGAALLHVGDEEVAEPEAADDEAFDCGECGKEVQAHESFCPHCGARFEDD